MGSLLLPCREIFKTVAHPVLSALCSVSSAPQHHWDSPQLPVVLTGTYGQLPYRPIRKAFTKAPANWISATFPCQMRL